MSQPITADTSDGYSLSDILGVAVEGQTYKNLLYIFLAFPLGLVYYILLTVGFTLGLVLSVVVVGLGLLLVTIVATRYIASFERSLSNRLLGTDIDPPDDVERESDGIVALAKAYLGASSTWRGLGFVVLKFWIGILSFILFFVFVGTAIDLMLAPVFPEGTLNASLNDQEIVTLLDTDLQRALAVPAGAVLALVGMHVLNAFARVNGSVASSLLGPESSEQDTAADAE
jgi:hypothetical protein